MEGIKEKREREEKAIRYIYNVSLSEPLADYKCYISEDNSAEED